MLETAAADGHEVLCLFVLEENLERSLGGATVWWLHHSLTALKASIEKAGGQLVLRRGEASDIISQLVDENDVSRVCWSRRYVKGDYEKDAELKEQLKEAGVEVISKNGTLLTEPWTIKTGSGGHYRVFTPYWKALQSSFTPRETSGAKIKFVDKGLESDKLADWGLLPTQPNWADGFEAMWKPGEAGAKKRLEMFLDNGLSDYGEHRNRPDVDNGTSGLSPHLRWGEIDPHMIWQAVKSRIDSGDANAGSATTFLSEIAWRDFSYVLLYYYPDLADENYNSDFAHMPWRSDDSALEAWQRGHTGYPIVDAGMRQLWETGWMHNRVRMIVASFLTKHLLLHWRDGEDWFWDTLVDADPASNAASWQWTAGSGADAAPYFRVFNPITQGEKFDPEGDYIRRWVPEIAELPTKHLYAPWDAPKSVLDDSGIKLGEDYPNPIVKHKHGRERALTAYETMKERRSQS